jgi:hypothetical protein
MYPSSGGDPLSSKLLDPGRDDYYGHSGGWTDTQDSPWLVRLDAQAPLALSITGLGLVRADVPGLICTASCTTTWNSGQRLTLFPESSARARFVRWTGACTGASTCSVVVQPGVTVGAVFARPEPVRYRLRVSVSGRGVVRTANGAIRCKPVCSAEFRPFTFAHLIAVPAKGWKIRSWGAACREVRTRCSVPISSTGTRVRATFVRR